MRVPLSFQRICPLTLASSTCSAQMPTPIDPATPSAALTRTGFDGEDYELVFSDEFELDGRTFWPGDDPFWEAVDLWYWATSDLEWYTPEQVSIGFFYFIFRRWWRRLGSVLLWAEVLLSGGEEWSAHVNGRRCVLNGCMHGCMAGLRNSWLEGGMASRLSAAMIAREDGHLIDSLGWIEGGAYPRGRRGCLGSLPEDGSL